MGGASRLFAVLGALAVAACASGGAADPAPDAAPAGLPASEPSAQGAVERASAEAVYTDAQADRGRDIFRSRCTECHNSSEFQDAQFRFKWSRRDLGTLYELASTTMPEDQPGSLPPQTYVDILAYILRLNGFVPGSAELTPDPERLGAISLAPLR
jgi:hypothetical protein